ncbi:MAG: pyridoxamine 5'-phosphate oxidase family protein [Pseudolabrys sp.]
MTDEFAAWIARQPLFFVATAPLGPQGHVNVSPRGLDTFRVLGPNEVAFLDLTGSGNESAAHLAENGRMTIMFCAFAGEPLILRLYGEGEVVLAGDAEWEALRAHFGPAMAGERQLIRLLVTRVQTSCGYGVPLMDLVGQREHLAQWARDKRESGVRRYWAEKNSRSIDGLPAPRRTP